jgi:hypothetical protein
MDGDNVLWHDFEMELQKQHARLRFKRLEQIST